MTTHRKPKSLLRRLITLVVMILTGGGAGMGGWAFKDRPQVCGPARSHSGQERAADLTLELTTCPWKPAAGQALRPNGNPVGRGRQCAYGRQAGTGRCNPRNHRRGADCSTGNGKPAGNWDFTTSEVATFPSWDGMFRNS